MILSDYWSHLSKQAVLNGAGVVKLFFDEVAKEKQTKTLYEKNRSWFEKMVDKSREGIFKVANVLYGITVPYNLETGGESAVTNQTASDRGVSSQPVETLLAQTAPTAPQSKNKTTEIGAAVENNQNSVWPQPRPAVPQPLAPQLKAPQAPSVELPLGQDNSPIVSGPSGGVNGGAPLNSPSNPSSAVSSQTQSQNQNQAQNSQAAGQDTTPPDAAIAVSECENSLSSSGCLIATTTLNISWSSGASDLDHYAVECLKNSSACSGFSVTANATSISFAADDGATYTFRAKALDTAGNESAYAEKEVEVNLRPVIINEIAWAGTAASTAADEWIELYNRASKSVNLSGWILRSVTDDKPYLHLSGGVSAHGYYLIERTDDNTVSDVAADFIASFGSGTGRGLVDTGEELALEYASTTIDATPTVNTCGLNQWCAGGSDQRLTMERVDPDLVGTDADSWASNNAIIRNGKSTDGIALNGTPKARNSQSYYISRTNNLAASKTIIKAKSPYFIDQYGLTIPSGLTLTIDPGVVIKFAANTSDLIIDGTLKAVGSAAEPIVFTSFYDDEYGGDLNSDGAASAPAPGNWRSVIFESSSQNSELSYVRVRYGGMRFSGQDRGGVLVDIRNTSPTVSNSIFEQSYQDGLKLINASSTLSGSTIQKNNAAASAYGVYVKGGAPVIEGNTFSQNPWGLAIESGSRVEVRNNTFSNNSVGAISSFGSVPEFSENTASGNAINGISLSGSLNSDYVFPKDLPYVIDGTLTLPQGKNFTVPAGVIFKGKSSSAIIGIEGVLHIQGQVSQPVLFTSWADDDYGGDTNNDGSAAVPHTGDWGSISFYASAGGSALENTIIRYAGAAAGSSALSLNAAVMDASNITVEKNRGSGIGLNNASSTLTGITVRDNNDAAIGDQYGLLLENNSKVLLANAVFRNNKVGVYVTGGSVLINGGGIDIDDSNITKTIPSGLLP